MAVYYPPAGFMFKVEFTGVDGMDSDKEQRFQEVSGLSVDIEVEEYREGGENRFSHKFPKGAKYPNLVLKRGFLDDSAVIDWFKNAMDTFFTVVIYDFKPADILVTLMDEAGEPLAVWKVIQAYPVKYAASGFNATQNAVMVETIELAYQYFERTQ
jgi:phage tail-like protein